MKTRRLFYEDSEWQEFEATVCSCKEMEEGYRIVLDQTAFFPEGGGQRADTGILERISEREQGDNHKDIRDGKENIQNAEMISQKTEQRNREYVQVLDVQEEEEVIYHMTDRPLEAGARIKGKLHWKERFSKMQHHTGEHIVSGLIYRYFGYHNVGFHLGSQVVTLDFDGVLTKEQLRRIEYEANEAVAQNISVLVTYPSREELPNIFYRSKIEIEGQVRIVEIPGYDTCACCAPHVKTTGQVGMIKLINMHNYKGGVRIYMLCGLAALADYNEKEESVKTIALSLCTQENQIVDRVEKLQEEIYKQKGIVMNLVNELLDYKVSSVPENAPVGLIIDGNLTDNQPRELTNKLMDKGVVLAAVFAGKDKDGYRYVLGSRSVDVRGIAKAMNSALQGRGGGKPEMAQGFVAGDQKKIVDYFAGLSIEE